MQCGSKRSGLIAWCRKPLSCPLAGMKKRGIGTLVALLIISFNCYSLTLGTSLSLRTPKNDSKPIDYEIGANVETDSVFSLDVEIERQEGEYYRNLELFAWQYWKSLQFSGKYINIQEDVLKNISIDCRYKHKSYSIGIAQTWDLQPETMLVAGKDIYWEFGILLKFRGITNFYTADFVNFNNETEIKFSTKLFGIISVYYRYKSRYYDDWNFSMKIGMELEL